MCHIAELLLFKLNLKHYNPFWQSSFSKIHIYMYIYIHTHTHTHTHTHIYIYIHTHTHTYIYVCMYIYYCSVLLSKAWRIPFILFCYSGHDCKHQSQSCSQGLSRWLGSWAPDHGHTCLLPDASHQWLIKPPAHLFNLSKIKYILFVQRLSIYLVEAFHISLHGTHAAAGKPLLCRVWRIESQQGNLNLCLSDYWADCKCESKL